MNSISNNKIRIPSIETVENVLWFYPDTTLYEKSKHLILLVSGKDNTGLGVWSWSYAAQLPYDNYIPITITLPKRNTDDLCYSGKFIVKAIEIIRCRFPDYKLSIIAHSMGNMAVSWALHFRPTFMSNHITDYIAIGSPFGGIDNSIAAMGKQPAMYQIDKTSNFIKEINSTPFPQPINYISIISSTDEAIGSTPEITASFPVGTIGEVKTPQEVYNNKKGITHVGEIGDNSIYEMVRAFLNKRPVDFNAAKTSYYPYLEKPGLDLTLQFGTRNSHAGDAPKVEKEPEIYDEIL